MKKFSGIFIVDTVDHNSDPSIGDYSGGPGSYFVEFENGFSISGRTNADVLDDFGVSQIDQLHISGFSPVPSEAITLEHSVTGDRGSVTLTSPYFQLRDDSGTALGSDQFPISGIDLDRFDFNYFTVILYSFDFEKSAGSVFPNVSVSGHLTSLTVAPIPLPAALPLFVSALGGLGLVGWRKKRASMA